MLLKKRLLEKIKPLSLVVNIGHFFTDDSYDNYTLWTCQDLIEALTFLLDNIYVRFGTSIYKQVIGIPMGTNCAPLVADLFLYCYERDFMLSLSTEHQDDIITAFNNTSRYLDDLLNIDNIHFSSLVNKIYPNELQLNKANTSDKQANFLDLNLSIENGYVTTKIYDKRDDFNFNIVNFPFFLVQHLTGFISHILFAFLELVIVLMILMNVIFT